jgi:hypothetical protein
VTPTEVKAVVGPELADGKPGKLSATEVKVLEWARHRMFGHGDSAAAKEIDKHLWGDEHLALVPNIDMEYIDHMELIDALVKGGTEIALFN